MKSMGEFMIDKAQKDSVKLKEQYGGCVVWIGDNHYIVVKDGQEIRI